MKFYVENQTIIPDGIQPKVVSNSQDFVACKFRFGERWTGLTKIVLFAQGENVYTQLLDETDCCMLPVEIRAGHCGISVYGADGGEATTATTNSYLVDVVQAGYYGEAIVPTADLYSQLLATIDSQLKGEPGADGQDGANGLTTSITVGDVTYTVDEVGNISLGALATEDYVTQSITAAVGDIDVALDAINGEVIEEVEA